MLHPDGAQVVTASALRARGDNWFPTFSHILAYAVVMPVLGYWLAEHLRMGVPGLLFAICGASLLSGGRAAVALVGDRRAAGAGESSRRRADRRRCRRRSARSLGADAQDPAFFMLDNGPAGIVLGWAEQRRELALFVEAVEAVANGADLDFVLRRAGSRPCRRRAKDRFPRTPPRRRQDRRPRAASNRFRTARSALSPRAPRAGAKPPACR